MADAFANLSKQERIEKAVCACQRDTKMTARRAAKIYNCAPSTISRRLQGVTKSKRLSGAEQQLLTPLEEQIIVKWVIQYYQWGLPLGLKQIRQFATAILLRKCPQPQGSDPPLGQCWHRRLLNRNPQIKRVVARGLDRIRASATLKVETLNEYFELYNSLRQKYKIEAEDTYNIDEKGFCMSAI